MIKRLAILILFMVPLLGCKSEETEVVTYSVHCSTEEPNVISTISAHLNASFSCDDAITPSEYYFYYSTFCSDEKSLKERGMIARCYYCSDNQTFSSFIDNLQPGRSYSYMSAVKVAGKEYLGEKKDFTTSDYPSGEIVTGEAINVSSFSAEVVAYATPSSGATRISYGFFFSDITDSPDLSNTGNKVEVSELKNGKVLVASLPKLIPNTLYYYRGYISYSGRYHYGEVHSFKTLDESDIELVDLGLSVLWRARNLGAYKGSQRGSFYAWGETYSKSSFTEGNYKFTAGTNMYSKYDNSRPALRDKKVLDPIDDASTKELGQAWHTPTVSEWMELCKECSWEWMTINGSPGSLVTGKTGESIFLPAGGTRIDFPVDVGETGYYWTSTYGYDAGSPGWAYSAMLSERSRGCSTWKREHGCLIRPVREK